MTLLRRLNFVLVFLSILAIALILTRQWILAGIAAVALVGFGFWWYAELRSELMIYHLKKNNGKMTETEIFKELPKSANTLQRLSKREIVHVAGEDVSLADPHQLCTFGRRRT